MTNDLIAAALSLADTLIEENEALRRLDIARAVALLARKQVATRTFADAQGALRTLPTEQLASARQLAMRLDESAAENKRLLERAIAVQGQVISVLLRAVPACLPVSRYGAAGTRVERLPPISLSSNA